MLDSIARFVDARGRLVVLAAIVFFLIAGALGGSVADRLDPYGNEDPATESIKAQETIEAAGFRDAGVIVLFEDAPVEEATTKTRIRSVERELRSRDDVASVNGFYGSGDRAFVAKDSDATYLAVALEPTSDRGQQDAAASIAEELEDEAGVLIGGSALAQEQVNSQVESDLQRAELMALPILILLSLLFFRSAVAALLPILIGGLAIIGTFLMLRVASELGSISIFALNITTALGLGLAIDYSLFIVSRYREEIAKVGPGLEAMRATMRTAGRTVLFSSLTVSAALASLIVFPQRFLYSMGIAGSLVALLAAAIALTVLPAVLTLLGHRVNSLAPAFLQRRAERDARPSRDGFWYRLSRFVMRRPLPIAIGAATLLIVVGIPFLSINFTFVDASILPEGASARQVQDTIRADFPPHRDTPLRIVIEGGGPDAVREVKRDVAADPQIATVLPARRFGGGISVLEAVSKDPFIADPSIAAVERLRELPEPKGAEVSVAGGSAEYVDFQDSLAVHLPAALAIVVVSTLILLFLMTGSVVLPIKSLLMNVLNLSAVFGILVLVFQDGRLEGLLDYTSQGGLEQTMPILLFAVAFGLSTDYSVFLLSRIKEARDAGASDSESVALGLERTGRIVTAAALLLAVAIGSFVTSEIIFMKQNGLGTAAAVLIDATIIRALLVPALMELLGKWNWWAPRPLRRLHARIGLSEA